MTSSLSIANVSHCRKRLSGVNTDIVCLCTVRKLIVYIGETPCFPYNTYDILTLCYRRFVWSTIFQSPELLSFPMVVRNNIVSLHLYMSDLFGLVTPRPVVLPHNNY